MCDFRCIFQDPANSSGVSINMVENVHKSRLTEATSDCRIRSAREINVNIATLFNVGKFCGALRHKFLRYESLCLLLLMKLFQGSYNISLENQIFLRKMKVWKFQLCYVGADLGIQGLEVQQR